MAQDTPVRPMLFLIFELGQQPGARLHHECDMQGRGLQDNENPCHSHRCKQDERMQFLVPTGVDAAPRLGQDPRWDSWSNLRERLGEEAGVCVVMCSCTRTDIICSSTDQYGSVAPVDVCRMSPSIAAPGQRLHGSTLQYWHRDSASGSAGSDAGP